MKAEKRREATAPVAQSSKGMAVVLVLRHPALLRLWLAQIIYLSVQFAASYAMIVLISEETHSATLVGLVILALSLPQVLLGAPAGALVDRMDGRRVLWVSNVVRALATALFVLTLMLAPHQYFAIYGLAFLFSLVGLFFSPAEGAMIPRLVGETELLPAMSLYNLTLNLSQAAGLLLLGPLALNLLPALSITPHLTFTPAELLFAAISLLYLIAAALTAGLPAGRPRNQPLREVGEALAELAARPAASHSVQAGGSYRSRLADSWRRLWEELREGWQLVRGDGVLFDGLWQACFGGLVMLVIAQLATTFVQRLLNLPDKDTALVFAPAGVGLVAGAILVPMLVGRLGANRTIVSGMVGTAIGIGLLPLAQQVARQVDPSAWWTNPLFLLVVAALTALVGLSLDWIIVPAQARMQERCPDELRGRVLALYQVLFNGGAIPVVLFIGILTDELGLVVVINLLMAFSLAAALLTIIRLVLRRRRAADPTTG